MSNIKNFKQFVKSLNESNNSNNNLNFKDVDNISEDSIKVLFDFLHEKLDFNMSYKDFVIINGHDNFELANEFCEEKDFDCTEFEKFTIAIIFGFGFKAYEKNDIFPSHEEVYRKIKIRLSGSRKVANSTDLNFN